MKAKAGLFITGVDTGCGKTFVTAAVGRRLVAEGVDVGVCKPVATGAEWVEGRWLAEDTRVLGEAVGAVNLARVTPFAFPEPAAPPVAARAAGVELRFDELVGAVERVGAECEFLLVEGVGGLLCPLTDSETVADLAGVLGLGLIVVARRSLGTLNHTLMTVEVARGRGLRVAGVVVSETHPPLGLAEETNVAELRRRLDVPLLGVAAHGDSDGLGGVDWKGLGSAL